MTIASVLACLCSIFQLFDNLGVFTILYLTCHVLLISFLYSSRYVALVVNTPPGAQGQIIATSTLIQLSIPILVTLSSQLLDTFFNDNYDDLSLVFLAITSFGLIFPIMVVVYRVKNK